MSTLENPSEKDIDAFCAALKNSLLDAQAMNLPTIVGVKQFTEEVFRPEYGLAPVDLRFAGSRFIAEVGKPAAKGIAKIYKKVGPSEKVS